MLGATHLSYSYEFDEFINDSKSSPEKVYDHLHPDTIKVIKTVAERLRNDDEYLDSVFLSAEPTCKGKTDREIWAILWNEFVGSDYFENLKLTGTILTENETVKLCVVEDISYGKYGRLFDVVAFKKDDKEYKLLMPETITVALACADL